MLYNYWQELCLMIADKRVWWVGGVRVGSTPCWRRRRTSACTSWSSWSWGAPGSPSGLPSSSHSGSSPSHSPPHTSSLHTSATGHTTNRARKNELIVCFCTIQWPPLPSIFFFFSHRTKALTYLYGTWTEAVGSQATYYTGTAFSFACDLCSVHPPETRNRCCSVLRFNIGYRYNHNIYW